MVRDAVGPVLAAEERQVDNVLDLGLARHQVVDVVGGRFSAEGGGIQGIRFCSRGRVFVPDPSIRLRGRLAPPAVPARPRSSKRNPSISCACHIR